MRRYFFHTQHTGLFSDEEGQELDDLASAEIVAIEHLAELVKGCCQFNATCLQSDGVRAVDAGRLGHNLAPLSQGG